MIRILFVGAGNYPMYENAFYNAANRIEGVEASIFTWKKYLDRIKFNLIKKIENKFSFGIQIYKFNTDLKSYCKKEKFDIIFLYSCRLVFASTVTSLKKTGAYIACYNNDNPFSDYYDFYFWRHYRKSIKNCDMVYVYRKSNIKDCKRYGAKNIKILKSYYIAERNFYIPDKEIRIEVPDILFLGHNENDERQEYIKALLEQGIKVGVPKSTWEDFESESVDLIKLDCTEEYYNEMLNKTKIAIVFLSKINKDTYTRRCFEIPIVKTLMLSIYTKDIASMYEEDKEIVFFRNKEDFVKKVIKYLNNKYERKQIAEAGYHRIIKDGHEAADRVQLIIDDYKEKINGYIKE